MPDATVSNGLPKQPTPAHGDGYPMTNSHKASEPEATSEPEPEVTTTPEITKPASRRSTKSSSKSND